MASSPTTEKVIPYALLGMTAVTGLVDAISFLSLGRVFTANMTGNVVLVAFAAARVPGLSLERSLAALVAFLAGATIGGRIMSKANDDSRLRFASRAFATEIALLSAAALCAVGANPDLTKSPMRVFALIGLTAAAMGVRNAAVRKLAVPDVTTTVLTLTITGIAADSSLAGGNNPRLARRAVSILAMFGGAGLGAVIIRHSLALALALAAAISLACTLALFRTLGAEIVGEKRESLS